MEEEIIEAYWDIYQIIDRTTEKELDMILIERRTGTVKRVVYRYEI